MWEHILYSSSPGAVTSINFSSSSLQFNSSVTTYIRVTPSFPKLVVVQGFDAIFKEKENTIAKCVPRRWFWLNQQCRHVRGTAKGLFLMVRSVEWLRLMLKSPQLSKWCFDSFMLLRFRDNLWLIVFFKQLEWPCEIIYCLWDVETFLILIYNNPSFCVIPFRNTVCNLMNSHPLNS